MKFFIEYQKKKLRVISIATSYFWKHYVFPDSNFYFMQNTSNFLKIWSTRKLRYKFSNNSNAIIEKQSEKSAIK